MWFFGGGGLCNRDNCLCCFINLPEKTFCCIQQWTLSSFSDCVLFRNYPWCRINWCSQTSFGRKLASSVRSPLHNWSYKSSKVLLVKISPLHSRSRHTTVLSTNVQCPISHSIQNCFISFLSLLLEKITTRRLREPRV